MLGTVKFYERFKGWGFITPDDQGVGEVFVHYSVLPKECESTLEKQNEDGHFTRVSRRWLNDGERVRFDVTDEGKGLKAVNVKVVKELGYE